MMTRGLLWFDDDARKPLPQKIAQAVMRYREREGYLPTVCEVNPQQAALTAPQPATRVSPKRARKTSASIGTSTAAGKGQFVVDTSALRITPNPSLRPNYILIGIATGEEPVRAPEFIGD
ncbi:MAG TPA: hypothetical protein VKQ36_17045, partial [Ktedonobacterales bacterium]|nr:hypothetical protein [Ktedonobacterales bacterium]